MDNRFGWPRAMPMQWRLGGSLVSGAAADARDTILGLLQAAEEPISLAKIRAGLGGRLALPAERSAQVLESLVAGQCAFRFSPYRSEGPRYWHADARSYARQVIERELAVAPLSLAVLDKKVAMRLADCPQAQRKEILEQLIQEGRVYQLPPLAGERSVVFSARSPDPRDYLRPHLEDLTEQIAELAEKLSSVGIRRQDTVAAARALCIEALSELDEAGAEQSPPDRVGSAPPAAPESLDQCVLRLTVEWTEQHRHGGLISVRELWQAVAPRFPDKPEFDAAVLKLGRDGKAWLYRHDFAASLSETDRQVLVKDSQGSYYNGISLRV